jgi:hypothetical protein
MLYSKEPSRCVALKGNTKYEKRLLEDWKLVKTNVWEIWSDPHDVPDCGF